MAVSVWRCSMLKDLFVCYWLSLMMSTLFIHMWSDSIAKRSHPSRGTCLDHIRSKSAAWWSPSTRGTCLDHIWSKSAVRQSPPTRGTFWTTFGWMPLRGKILWQGAQFGPHLVKVCCVASPLGCAFLFAFLFLAFQFQESWGITSKFLQKKEIPFHIPFFSRVFFSRNSFLHEPCSCKEKFLSYSMVHK